MNGLSYSHKNFSNISVLYDSLKYLKMQHSVPTSHRLRLTQCNMQYANIFLRTNTRIDLPTWFLVFILFTEKGTLGLKVLRI